MHEVDLAVAALPVLGLGLCAVVAESGRSAVAVASVAELGRQLPFLQPRVVVVDAALPDALDGVEVALRDGGSTVVVLGDEPDDEDLLLAAVRAGANGVLRRDVPPPVAVRALAAAARGESLLPRTLVPRVLADLRSLVALSRGRLRDPSHGPVLTGRERQVLEMMRAGLSTAVIAERLVVAPVTVRTHVCAVRRKLHLAAGPAGSEPTTWRAADELADDAVGHLAHLRIS
jgi:DNA-binding NarL/FixJ family response regulator